MAKLKLPRRRTYLPEPDHVDVVDVVGTNRYPDVYALLHTERVEGARRDGEHRYIYYGGPGATADRDSGATGCGGFGIAWTGRVMISATCWWKGWSRKRRKSAWKKLRKR